ATGIDGGKGQDTIENHGQVDSTADETSVSTGVAVTVIGDAGAISTATAASDAAAIAGGDGADAIANDADLNATSKATATGVSVAVTVGGVSRALDATWNGATTATATAKGISGGDGDDAVLHSAKTVT